MRAIIVGAVESTRVALRAVAASSDWDVAALVTLPAELAGRHSDFVDLAPEARDAGARVIHAADSNAPDVLDMIAAIAPDIVLVIGWSQICKPGFLAAARGRVLGYHPAPLPQLRGRGVIPWTILLGHTITASTLFWIDTGVDSGPILAQRFLHVASDETVTSLYARHMEALEGMLAESLSLLAAGTAPSIVQDERYASWAARRTPDDGRIDWRLPAKDIWRLIRATGRPYPGAFTHTLKGRLIVWEAELCDCSRHAAALPGQIVARDDGGFAVRCGDGAGIRVTDWEAEDGKRPAMHAVLDRGAGP